GPTLLIPGVRTEEDMMRGEEVQVIGANARGEEGDATIILPGTHSKHVNVERGQAVTLKTFMSGEFFELLARHSILAHSVDDGLASNQPGADAAFIEGVEAGAAGN